MTLSPLTPADIAEVMRLERLPGYEAFIGRWEAGVHAAEMASPDARYFGVRGAGGLDGFIILQEVGKPQVRLRRIAVGAPGGGLGGRMLRAIMDHVFRTTTAGGLWLDVHVDNARAQRVYEREGLEPQGMFDDVHRRMAIPRTRWEALRTQ
jgi:RimJ/RimL family protein N-acetyltransferase